MSITVCSCGTYTFYIEKDSIVTQVYPTNFLETSLLWEPEPDQMFYRQKFQGSLIFGGRGLKTDFDYFWAIEQATPCERLYITIYRDSYLYWTGYFSTSNGSWNLDDCTFTITPFVYDWYTDILDEADLEYNILSALTEVTTTYDNGSGSTTAYTHNFLFYDVIEYLVQRIDATIVVDSHFFEDAVNYVTLSDNRYNYLTIAQKSDIKRPASSNPATVGMMTLSQALYICRCMNLFWDIYYDYEHDQRVFIIEHVSYWPEDTGTDIRSQKIARGTNKYRYLNEAMPKYEKFTWMEAGNTEFTGYPIWYNSDCVNQDSNSNVTEYNFSNVTTDLDYIINCMSDTDSENIISDDGWVLLANELRGADLYIWFNVGLVNTYSSFANCDLAWTYLHRLFWMHDRQLIRGYLNNLELDFYTARKTKQQECSIVDCDTEFDPTLHLTTELGETYLSGVKGKIGRAIMHPQGQIDLTLLYGPANNINAGYTYDKIVHIWEAKTGDHQSTFYGRTNQVANVQIDIVFNIDIQDAELDLCTTANKTLTILLGAYTGSVVVDWCNPDDPAAWSDPTCIIGATLVSITAGWSVDSLTANISDDSECV